MISRPVYLNRVLNVYDANEINDFGIKTAIDSYNSTHEKGGDGTRINGLYFMEIVKGVGFNTSINGNVHRNYFEFKKLNNPNE